MKSMQLHSSELYGNEPAGDGTFQNNLALFGALCLFLSAVEYMIPKPLPFLRIGLANLPLMLALDVFPLPSFLMLVCIKVSGQALITGTLFSYVFLFSAAGAFCSALLMFALRYVFKQRISFIGIGTAGAFVSNGAQLLLACFFVFKESVKYIAPVFLGAGLVTGAVLGVFCEGYVKKSKFYLNAIKRKARIVSQSNEDKSKTLRRFEETRSASFALNKEFIIGLLIIPLILLNPSTKLRVIVFLVLWLLAVILKKKTNPLFTILFIVTIIAFNLIIPYGRVLYSIGSFKITSGALTAGIHRAFTFQSLVMLSKLAIRDDLKLPGKFGNLLGESLRIFSGMMNRKPNFKNKNIIEVIDDMLLNINNNPC